MGLFVDGGGLWATKSKMEWGGQNCKLNPTAWSRGRLSGGGMQSML